jgi:hypothetical protein
MVEPVINLKGVIARVKHKKTKAHVPVERVMNSIGLAPSPSNVPSQNKRSSGNNPKVKMANLKIFIIRIR